MPSGVDTSRMYPPRIIEFSRRLYDDGEGRTTSEIRDALAKRGYHPKLDTVRYWVDDEYREEKLRAARKFRPPGPARRKGWQMRRDRMRDLREVVGLSASATGRLMAHDYGINLTRSQVEDVLAGRVKKAKTLRRLLCPQTTATSSTQSHDERSSAMQRQGDILLVPVKKLPAGLKEVPREGGKIVLAEGEATGHLHAIEAPEATFLAEDLGSPEGRFLVVKEAEAITAEAAGVELTHPEHDTVVVEPGAYEVRRQREYSQAGGIELVSD